MKKKLVFIIIFGFVSCQQQDFDIDNLNGDKISILGHGGMGIGHTYPMNSFESLLYCLNIGADGTELDVQMTKDSVLVAYHSLELSSNTNAKGYIYKKQWHEIKDACYRNPVYTDYKVISLDMLFSGLGNVDKKLFIFDCKAYNPDTSTQYRNVFCNALLRLIDAYNIQDNVIIEFEREDLIQTLKSLRPNLNIFFYADFESGLFDNGIKVANKYELQGIDIAMDNITKEQVKIAHQNGLQVAVFNTHTNKQKSEAIKKNVDIIQTDNVKQLIRMLK